MYRKEPPTESRRDRFGRWITPRYGRWGVTAYRVAHPGWRIGVNRIGGHRIGWFVVLGRWSVGLCKPRKASDG